MTQVPEELTEFGFEEVRILRLEPDDAIVVMVPRRISSEEQHGMLEQLTRLFPAHRVLVLDGGMSVKALRGSAL